MVEKEYTHAELVKEELEKSLKLLEQKQLTSEDIKWIRKSLGLNKEKFSSIFCLLDESCITDDVDLIDFREKFGMDPNEMIKFSQKFGMDLYETIKFSKVVSPVIKFYLFQLEDK